MAEAARRPPARTANYGQRIPYAQGVSIQFPDFVLTYLGTRRGKPDQTRPSFIYYDFRVSLADETLIVSWSGGTGDIGPVSFSSLGYNYRLERVYSDRLGALAGDEVVVWQDGPFRTPSPTTSPTPTAEPTRLRPPPTSRPIRP